MTKNKSCEIHFCDLEFYGFLCAGEYTSLNLNNQTAHCNIYGNEAIMEKFDIIKQYHNSR